MGTSSYTSSSSDLAESYMEKLTRLRSKHNSRRNQTGTSTTTTAPAAKSAALSRDPPAFGGLGLPNPSLVEIKKQFQNVKAMSPHKPSNRTMRPNQLCPPSPQSPSPS